MQRLVLFWSLVDVKIGSVVKLRDFWISSSLSPQQVAPNAYFYRKEPPL